MSIVLDKKYSNGGNGVFDQSATPAPPQTTTTLAAGENGIITTAIVSPTGGSVTAAPMMTAGQDIPLPPAAEGEQAVTRRVIDSNNGILPGNFRIMNIINSGSFGTVFQAIERNLKLEVAVKVLKNPDQETQAMLEDEVRILKDLSGVVGVPKVFSYGNTSSYQYVAMSLLDKDLGFYFTFCQKRLSIKTVLMLAVDILTIMEGIHDAGYIHRDLKPENIMLGKGKDDALYVVDFGMSKTYWKPLTASSSPSSKIQSNPREHIEERQTRQFVGTYRYCSLTAHKGNEQSRRDDLESLGYILIYFAKGKLPWQGINSTRKEYVQNMKTTIKIDELTKGLPQVFRDYMQTVKQLEFKERPQYRDIIASFKTALKGLSYSYDRMYDWKIHKIRRNQKKARNNTVIVVNNEKEVAKMDTVVAQRQQVGSAKNERGVIGGGVQIVHKTVSHNVMNFGSAGGGLDRRRDRFGTLVSNQTMMSQNNQSSVTAVARTFTRGQSRAKTKKSTYFTEKQHIIEEKESVDQESSKFLIDMDAETGLSTKISQLNQHTCQPKYLRGAYSKITL